MDTGADVGNVKLLFWLIFIGFTIALIGMPMHILSGYYIGIMITKIDINNNNENNDVNDESNIKSKYYIGVLKFTILFRSIYLYLLIVGVILLKFNFWGILLVGFGTLIEYYFIIKLIKKEEQELPFDYLQRVGQLTILGYGLLPDGPEYDNINSNSNNQNNGINIAAQNMSINNDVYNGDDDDIEINVNNDIINTDNKDANINNNNSQTNTLIVPNDIHDDSDDSSGKLIDKSNQNEEDTKPKAPNEGL